MRPIFITSFTVVLHILCEQCSVLRAQLPVCVCTQPKKWLLPSELDLQSSYLPLYLEKICYRGRGVLTVVNATVSLARLVI